MTMVRSFALIACLGVIVSQVAAREAEPEAVVTPSPPKSQSAAVKPLFDVDLDFEFDDAEATFNAVKSLLMEHYYTGSLTEESLYWAAIAGMLRHVSPPKNPRHATLWTEAQYERVLHALRGQRHSVGIKTRFSPKDGSLTVTAINPGSPADGKLKLHDRIMRIDGKPLKGRSSAQIKAILERENPPLALTVVRDINLVEVSVQPAIHPAAALKTLKLPEQIAYLGVRRITKNVSKQIETQVRAWLLDGIDRVIIDLRGNGGGVFIEGLRIAELFVPEGKALLQTAREGKPAQRFVSSNAKPLEITAVVLMNERTASSAEALITALVTNTNTRIVGQKSFGKATMDKTFKLANNMRVRFIIGAMYTATGQSWHSRGLAPTIEVAGKQEDFERWSRLPDNRRMQADRQLRSAWQMLRKR